MCWGVNELEEAKGDMLLDEVAININVFGSFI